MTYAELLDRVESELPRLEALAVEAIDPLDEKQFNAPVDGEWSIAKVVQHLILSDGPYIRSMREAVESAKPESGGEVRHTFLGGKILKFAGPQGNAPVPKPFSPAETTYPKSIVQEWQGINAKLVELAQAARGLDLATAKFQNPVFKLVSMNLCDGFAIAVDHTDRHVRQIVARAAKLSS